MRVLAHHQMCDTLASKAMNVAVRAYRHHPAHGHKPLSQADLASWRAPSKVNSAGLSVSGGRIGLA